MSEKAANLHKIIDFLDDTQVDVLYSVALGFIGQLDPEILAQKDFDYISPEESEAIERAFDEVEQGKCMAFVPEYDMEDYFNRDR